MQHHFNIKLAKEYGILEAVLLENLKFWILKNIANEQNYYDGEYWTYNSVRAFSELFPYASEKQIRTALKHLGELGLIKTGNYNKSAYDRTLWYAFTDKGKLILQIGNSHLPKWENENGREGEPIPYNKPDIKTTYNKPNKKKEGTFEDVFVENNVDGKLKEAFIELIKSRKLNKKNMTNKALELAIKKVRKLEESEDRQVQVIYQSIENGWQGLFPLKDEPAAVGKEVVHQVKDGEDISWRIVFELWKKLLGYWVPETETNVQAARDLLKAEGEQNVEIMIATLRMRGEYSFLNKGLKNICDIAGLWANRLEVWRFYLEHREEWAEWTQQAAMGKKKWQL